MNRISPMLCVCFCAGLLGALVNSLAAWQLGKWGLPALLEVRLAPTLTAAWLYPRLVWGGLWGCVYFLTVGPQSARRHWVRKGLWVSLLPTAFQLLYVFPSMTGHGWLGFELGQMTGLFVLLYNLIWGFATGIFCRLLWGGRR